MSIHNLNTTNSLDRIRINEGIDSLIAYFHKLVENNTDEAIALINDENLHFASFFVLRFKISEHNLIEGLVLRNKVALEFINEILDGKKGISIMKHISSDYAQIAYSVLKWVFETGFFDDGLSNEFDEVLDLTAILLTRLYRDQKILPIIADMIFNRNRKNLYVHDLVWAFFESKDPYSLVMIANRLLSSEEKDVDLACKLLSFVPGVDDNNLNKQKKYTSFLNWIEENSLFLYFTGQSLQQTNKPAPYVVTLEAKYLCKFISIDTGKPLKPLTDKEKQLLNEFNKLDLNTKIFLSSFSSIMHHKDENWWNTWISYPISNQIETAKAMIGGEQ